MYQKHQHSACTSERVPIKSGDAKSRLQRQPTAFHEQRRLRSLRLEEGDQSAHLAEIEAIDRVLANVLGFTGGIAAETKDFRREALFGRNELRRAVIAVLREANGPMTTRQIAERVMATKGKALKPGRVAKNYIRRVRVVCQHLPVERGMVNDVQVWRQN